jgi:ribA/ribD-fused uncharacterized protein
MASGKGSSSKDSAMNNMPITEFQGEHRWLSNFWPVRIMFEGRVYPSVENAYQAAKFVEFYRPRFQTVSAGEAKRLARSLPLRPDWKLSKLAVMKELLERKFPAYSTLAEKLLATGDSLLIEGNNWGDTFWGICRGRGENHLGKLLMQRRAELKQGAQGEVQ